MTVKEILIEWLIEHDYSGLWNEDECGCPIDDLILCNGEAIECCQPGYRVKCDPEASDSGYDFMIVSEKPREVIEMAEKEKEQNVMELLHKIISLLKEIEYFVRTKK